MTSSNYLIRAETTRGEKMCYETISRAFDTLSNTLFYKRVRVRMFSMSVALPVSNNLHLSKTQSKVASQFSMPIPRCSLVV